MVLEEIAAVFTIIAIIGKRKEWTKGRKDLEITSIMNVFKCFK